MSNLIEEMCAAVHTAYCDNYKIRKGEEYWTKGDYSLLDDEQKEIDRATVAALRPFIDAEIAAAVAKAEEGKEALLKALEDLVDATPARPLDKSYYPLKAAEARLKEHGR